jgi:hypothetical protein
MKNQLDNEASGLTRRKFVKGVTGMAAATSVISMPVLAQQVSERRVSPEDPGISFILSPDERDRGARLLTQAMNPFLGDWIGVREGRDTAVRSPSVRRYYPYLGGPQVVGEVEVVGPDHVAVFRAAKHVVFSPARDTLLTYFFEIGADVQIFELDRKELDRGVLMWNEILRKGRLFRVEEPMPKNDEWAITVWQQDTAGKYQVYAKETLSREYKEAYRRRR